MKKIILLIFLGAFFIQCSPKVNKDLNKKDNVKFDFRSKAPKPKPAPEVKFGDYKIVTLDNGLKIIVVENNKVPKVSMRLFLDRKPVLEGNKAGYIELTGELLSRGSKNKSKAQLDEEIDFIGADFVTFSKGFYMSGLSKYSDKMLAIAADAIRNPAFPKEEFEKLKTQKLSQLASAKDDPNSIASNVKSVLDYGKNHPFGEVVSEKTVNNITLEDCKNYYNNFFNPADGYLVFVGDINYENAKKLAEKYFGDWQAKLIPGQKLTEVNGPVKTTVDFVPKRGAVQSVLSITYPVNLTPNSEDIIKARVMNTLFGGFFRSRLNQNLREDHAYTYGIRSSLRDNPVIGEFEARASVRNEVTDSAIYQIIYEMNKLRNEKVSDKELKLVKSVMTGNFGRALEDPATIANFALKTERFNLPKNFYHDYLKNLAAVTADDIMEMANKYLRPDKANIVVVGDKKSVAGKLNSFGEVHFYDFYGNEVKENSSKAKTESISLDKLFEGNINALGGKDKVKSVKTIETEYTASIQGMEMKLWELKVNGQKSAMKVIMMGQAIQEQKFDGEKGVQIAQGRKKTVSDEDLEDIKSETFVFPVCALKKDNDVKLTGTETIDGKEYYILEQKSEKKTSLYYFNTKTFLLEMIEIISSVNGMEQKISQKYSDYKKHDGVMIPEKITLSGAMPMPIDFKLTKIEINGEIDENAFKVD